MTIQKKIALVFLSIINIMNIAAGIMTQVKIITGSDVTSIIPITLPLTVNQILLVNFVAVVAIMMLISIVVTYLVTDVPYSPKEILSNCPMLLMIVPVIIFLVGIYSAVTAPETSDKLWIIISQIFYVIANVINFGCILTVREDAE